MIRSVAVGALLVGFACLLAMWLHGPEHVRSLCLGNVLMVGTDCP
jgi:hypothetical protein